MVAGAACPAKPPGLLVAASYTPHARPPSVNSVLVFRNALLPPVSERSARLPRLRPESAPVRTE